WQEARRSGLMRLMDCPSPQLRTGRNTTERGKSARSSSASGKTSAGPKRWAPPLYPAEPPVSTRLPMPERRVPCQSGVESCHRGNAHDGSRESHISAEHGCPDLISARRRYSLLWRGPRGAARGGAVALSTGSVLAPLPLLRVLALPELH